VHNAVGTVIDFTMLCAQNLWSGPADAPLDLREAFCTCVLARSQARYDVEEFDRIWDSLVRGGYRADAAGVPPGFADILSRCRSELDRGKLRVQ
jgi:hypothetical protein